MNTYDVYEKKNNHTRNTAFSIIATLILAGINVVVFFVLDALGDLSDARFMAEHGAMYVPYVIGYGKWYTLITSMFVHFGISHLANNMLLLVGVGNYMERLMGRWKFVSCYLISGLCGNIVSMLYDLRSGEYAVSAGASGAVFGIIGGLLWIVLRNKGRVANLTTRGLIFMIALSLYFGFTSAGIDNAAHIGGLLCGFVCSMIVYRKR